MKMKLAMLFILSCGAFAQTQLPTRIRVSDRVMNKLADNKVLPEVADLKGKDLDSLVVIQIVINTEGAVKFAKVQEGEPALAERSLAAAQKWHYKPYILNGEPISVDTWIRFKYTKDSVEIVVPER